VAPTSEVQPMVTGPHGLGQSIMAAGGEKPEVLMEDRKQRQGNAATIPH
jgi:hypothetical protein